MSPEGFISKKYPVRPSRNVSMIHMKRSSEPSPCIAAPLKADQLVRFGVEAGHAHVERVVVVGDPHLGAFGGRSSVRRIDLDEISGWGERGPERLIQATVEGDHADIGQTSRGDRTLSVALGRRLLCQSRQGRQTGHTEREQESCDSQTTHRHQQRSRDLEGEGEAIP